MRAVNQMSALRSIFAKTSRPVAGATRQFCFAAGQRYAHATVEGQAHHYYYHRPRSGRFLAFIAGAGAAALYIVHRDSEDNGHHRRTWSRHQEDYTGSAPKIQAADFDAQSARLAAQLETLRQLAEAQQRGGVIADSTPVNADMQDSKNIFSEKQLKVPIKVDIDTLAIVN